MSSNRINLVAGAAGFIGTHLAEALLRKGEKVIGVDSMITGSQENVSRLIGRPNFSFIHHDIAEPLKIDGDIHCIYNFACPASPIDLERLRIAILRACSLGSYNLLELARTKHARYIYASTSEVYGNPFEHPQKENYHGNVSITGVRAVYDEGKRYGETMLTVYGHEYDVEVRTVRVFNTHGEHMRVMMVALFPHLLHKLFVMKTSRYLEMGPRLEVSNIFQISFVEFCCLQKVKSRFPSILAVNLK